MSGTAQLDVITLSGAAIEYRLIAAPAPGCPTLVFLHEGLGCAALWRNFPDQLCAATGCGGLLYSRLGYGGSDACDLPRPLDYMQQEADGMLPQILAHFQIDDFLLVGHSDGASIALIYAGTDKKPAAKAVIAMAPHVFCEDVSVCGIRFAKRAYEQADLKNRLEKYHGKNTETAFRGWNDAWLNLEFRDWNIESVLPQISVPVLAIQGLDDAYGTLAQIDAVETGVAGSFEKKLLENCGHAPWAEKRDVVLEISAAFIKRLD